MNHDERKLAGFKCILLLTIWLILCWVLQAMEVAIDHIGCCTSKKQGRSEITGWDEKRAVRIRDEEEAGRTTTTTKVAALCAKQKA
jgi:hypothetical protein